jgi:hypothetical protein
MEVFMMSKGFIVEATWDENKSASPDYVGTDLHVEDCEIGVGNDADTIINLFIATRGQYLYFTRPEALALVEAFTEILSRYPKSEDGNS